MTRWWMVRAGDNNELIPTWIREGIASIGWLQLGDPEQYNTKEEMKGKSDEVFNEENPRSRNSWVKSVAF